MKLIATFLIVILALGCLNAQAPDFQWGIQSGNHLSLPAGTDSEAFKGKSLLRYSIGVMARRVLKRGMKANIIAPLRRGVIALDLGINMVFKGYNYQFNDFETYTDQVEFEFPILLILYDERNIFVPRKWYRKGLSTYSRMGIIPSYLPRRKLEKTLRLDNETLIENTVAGGFDILMTVRGGLLQNHKNGNSTALELGGNVSFISKTKGQLVHQDANGQVLDEGLFFSTGTYISLNLVYLFQVKKPGRRSLRRPPPIIYNPRNLDGAN